MEYDPRLGVTLLHGGLGRQVYGDLWQYDGTSWSVRGAPPAALGPRKYHRMVHDAARQLMVLFGGSSSASIFNDTWEYDGNAWSQGPSAPPELLRRQNHGMVYDAPRERVLLIGGALGGELGDVWAYDGIAWTGGEALPSEAIPCTEMAVAYDPARSSVVLFSGWQAGRPARRTYELGQPGTGVAVGAGLGPTSPNLVRLLDGEGEVENPGFAAFSAGQWGVRVAVADLGGGFADILAGPGPGSAYGPQVRGFRIDATPIDLVSFYAYGTLRFGVNVATASPGGVATDDILTGPGPGGVFGPHVRGWRVAGGTTSPLPGVSFYAYGTPRFGVEVASGDVDDDGADEILTGPGPGSVFATHVRGFDADGGAVRPVPGLSFDALGLKTHGANVAGGDVDGDGIDEIVAAPGPGPGVDHISRYRGFSYQARGVEALPGFDLSTFPGTVYGGRMAVGLACGEVHGKLIVAPGQDPAAAASIEAWSYDGTSLGLCLGPLDALPGQAYGATVAAGDLGL